MVPTFRSGDFLLVDRKEEYVVGNIIVFEDPEQKRYVVHRICGINGSILQTRGDNNLTKDRRQIDQKEVIGAVCAIENNGVVPIESKRIFQLKARLKWAFLDIQREIRRLVSKMSKRGRSTKVVRCSRDFLLNALCKRMAFNSPQGRLVKYVFWGRTVTKNIPNYEEAGDLIKRL